MATPSRRACMSWPGMQVTTKVRLRGIDAAEVSARCAEEYRLAAAARDALQRMLAEGGVTIAQIGLDKYGGRVLANAATREWPDISEALLKTGLVRAYDGGRREQLVREIGRGVDSHARVRTR